MPERPSQPPMFTWTVGPQMLTTGPDGKGGYTPGYQVTFTLSNGHEDNVFVPGSTYSRDTVRAAIQAKAEEIAAIASMTGTVGQA